MSGQLTSKIKIPKSQVELINLIFAELEITFHNQFHKAFPDEETLTLAKQLWLAKLEKYENESRACGQDSHSHINSFYSFIFCF